MHTHQIAELKNTWNIARTEEKIHSTVTWDFKIYPTFNNWQKSQRKDELRHRGWKQYYQQT